MQSHLISQEIPDVAKEADGSIKLMEVVFGNCWI